MCHYSYSFLCNKYRWWFSCACIIDPHKRIQQLKYGSTRVQETVNNTASGYTDFCLYMITIAFETFSEI